jgi:hypothetical protein
MIKGDVEIKPERKGGLVKMQTNENTGNQPEKRFSTGAITATVWKNGATSKKDGSPVEFNTITLQRRYTDKEGVWKSTNSMRVNDLPKAILVLNKAYEHLVIKEQDASPSGEISINEEKIVM